jgi:hypothetical protein
VYTQKDCRGNHVSLFVRDGVCTQDAKNISSGYVKYQCVDHQFSNYNDNQCSTEGAKLQFIPDLGTCIVDGKRAAMTFCGGQMYALPELTVPLQVDSPVKGVIKTGAMYDPQLIAFVFKWNNTQAFAVQVDKLTSQGNSASDGADLKLLATVDGMVPTFDHFIGFRRNPFEKQGNRVIVDPHDSHVIKYCRASISAVAAGMCRIIMKVFADKRVTAPVQYEVRVMSPSSAGAAASTLSGPTKKLNSKKGNKSNKG